METSTTPKVGDVIEIKKNKYTIIRDKGDLSYAALISDAPTNLCLVIWKTKTVIETKVPSDIFRMIGKKIEKYPKEIEIKEKQVLIWGTPLKKLGEGVYAGESLSFQVQHKKTIVTLNIRFRTLILDSVTTA